MSDDVPGIDFATLTPWFSEHVEPVDGLSAKIIGHGRSNLTYRIESDGRAWVLRRPPLSHVLPDGPRYEARVPRHLGARADRRCPCRTPSRCARTLPSSARRSTSCRSSRASCRRTRGVVGEAFDEAHAAPHGRSADRHARRVPRRRSRRRSGWLTSASRRASSSARCAASRTSWRTARRCATCRSWRSWAAGVANADPAGVRAHARPRRLPARQLRHRPTTAGSRPCSTGRWRRWATRSPTWARR